MKLDVYIKKVLFRVTFRVVLQYFGAQDFENGCKINFFKLHLRVTFVKIVLITDNQACLG
jgi:hypothetical protein